ncbi:hypothetical protein K438DRAFT_1772855 [Mycena galopus ATCC 62051]|nr:hypothetical protein K438DRAFT_1772855 [Mycena galopus ATCC 62051]
MFFANVDTHIALRGDWKTAGIDLFECLLASPETIAHARIPDMPSEISITLLQFSSKNLLGTISHNPQNGVRLDLISEKDIPVLSAVSRDPSPTCPMLRERSKTWTRLDVFCLEDVSSVAGRHDLVFKQVFKLIMFKFNTQLGSTHKKRDLWVEAMTPRGRRKTERA